MLLLLHILIALSGLVVSIINFFLPSKIKLHSSYLLTAFTIASGTALVIIMHTSILRTCMTGLAYLAIVSIATIFARRKLVASEQI